MMADKRVVRFFECECLVRHIQRRLLPYIYFSDEPIHQKRPNQPKVPFASSWCSMVPLNSQSSDSCGRLTPLTWLDPAVILEVQETTFGISSVVWDSHRGPFWRMALVDICAGKSLFSLSVPTYRTIFCTTVPCRAFDSRLRRLFLFIPSGCIFNEYPITLGTLSLFYSHGTYFVLEVQFTTSNFHYIERISIHVNSEFGLVKLT